MTHSFSAVSSVFNRLLGGFRKPALLTQAPPEKPEAVVLKQILPVTARRRGGGPAFTLLVGEMSTGSVRFRTAAPVAEGDRLNLEMLLQGFGPVNLEGQVHWLLLSPGGYQGEIQLAGGVGDQVVLDHYLRRQVRGVR